MARNCVQVKSTCVGNLYSFPGIFYSKSIFQLRQFLLHNLGIFFAQKLFSLKICIQTLIIMLINVQLTKLEDVIIAENGIDVFMDLEFLNHLVGLILILFMSSFLSHWPWCRDLSVLWTNKMCHTDSDLQKNKRWWNWIVGINYKTKVLKI